MRLFKWLLTWTEDDSPSQQLAGQDDPWSHGPIINPATGLTMINGAGSVDVLGNPYGTDLQDWASTDCFMGQSDWSSFDFHCHDSDWPTFH